MDDLQAVYSGGIPLGFNNFTFLPALHGQPEKGLGRRFEAFVIPKQCPTFKLVEHVASPTEEIPELGDEK